MNKISIRGILLRAGIALATVFASVSLSFGQYESLNPRSWFPLEKGNAWEYNFGFYNWILVSTVDTVAHGLSWRKFSVVQCSGPSCLASDQWYAFNSDDYVLRTESFVVIDTAFGTLPTSAFRTSSAVDSTLMAPCHPGDEYEPGGAVIRESMRGSAEDSTNLELLFGPVSGEIFCEYGFFAYKIGYLGPGDIHLTGAIVDGLEWGLTDRLRTILFSEPNTLAPRTTSIQVYPNPSHGHLTAYVLVARTGTYEVFITTPLGRMLTRHREYITANMQSRIDIRVDGLSAGTYFIRLTDGLTTKTSGFVVVP